jgi:Phage tail tube protein
MSVTNAREYLLVVRESALNTPIMSPVLGTDMIYIRLADGNAFKMRAKPVIQKVSYGGGFAVAAEAISDHYAVEGTLDTLLYPAQAQLLLDWATTRINSAQTSPWTTTEVPGDLASCTVYHAIRQSTGAYNLKQFSGVKVTSAKIDVSREATIAKLSLGLMGSKQVGFGTETGDPTSTPFPAPAETSYPTGPYTFAMTAGQLSIGGSTRTGYASLGIDIKNAIDGQWFETSFRQVLQFLGRESQLSTKLFYKPSPNDGITFESLTAQAAEVTFQNGVTGQNLTINFNGQNTISDLPYDLPLDKVYMIDMTLDNRFDPSAPGDFVFSLA